MPLYYTNLYEFSPELFLNFLMMNYTQKQNKNNPTAFFEKRQLIICFFIVKKTISYLFFYFAVFLFCSIFWIFFINSSYCRFFSSDVIFAIETSFTQYRQIIVYNQVKKAIKKSRQNNGSYGFCDI